jgi:murein DD-endopeptidase MepM/ murein hydrolase activator NlpD
MENDSTRRTFLKQSAATAATAVVGSGLAATASAAKNYGYLDPVFTTSSLNIREGAGTSYGVKATAEKRTGGRIYEGPESADGYNWWKVNFSGDTDNGRVTGWVAENWLSSANFICPMTGTVTSNWDDCRPLGSCTRQHKAVDIADGGGTPITAAAGGTAEHRWDGQDGYGNWLIIYHGNGWKTGYGHLSSFAVGRAGESGRDGRLRGQHRLRLRRAPRLPGVGSQLEQAAELLHRRRGGHRGNRSPARLLLRDRTRRVPRSRTSARFFLRW